ncbi:MAG: hypothetical protein WBX25_23645 [Rhodomicrobium sp.]
MHITMYFVLFASTSSPFAQPDKLASKPGDAPQQPKQPITISGAELAMLIKSTIMALQNANQTGNYSVLRDLGTPVFRERFDQAMLTAAFANLRVRHVNLTPILLLQPNLTKGPELTPRNQLHITGYFQTQPLQVKYEMLLLQIDGVWRIDGLAVDAVPGQAQTALAPFDTKTEAQKLIKSK